MQSNPEHSPVENSHTDAERKESSGNNFAPFGGYSQRPTAGMSAGSQPSSFPSPQSPYPTSRPNPGGMTPPSAPHGYPTPVGASPMPSYSPIPTYTAPVSAQYAFTGMMEIFKRGWAWMLLQSVIFGAIPFFSLFFVFIGLSGASDSEDTAGAVFFMMTMFTLSFVVVPVYSALFMSALFNLIKACLDGEEIRFETIFRFRRLGSAIGLSFIIYFLLIGSAVLITGPIFVAVFTMFAFPILFEDTNNSISDALRGSFNIVKNDIGGSLLTLFGAGLIGILYFTIIGIPFIPYLRQSLFLVGARQSLGRRCPAMEL